MFGFYPRKYFESFFAVDVMVMKIYEVSRKVWENYIYECVSYTPANDFLVYFYESILGRVVILKIKWIPIYELYEYELG